MCKKQTLPFPIPSEIVADIKMSIQGQQDKTFADQNLTVHGSTILVPSGLISGRVHVQGHLYFKKDGKTLSGAFQGTHKNNKINCRDSILLECYN